MKSKNKVGVGLTSIIMIILSFCLTIFAMEGLLTAKNNKRISDARCEHIKEYYSADKTATIMYADIKNICIDNCMNTKFISDILADKYDDITTIYELDGVKISYNVEINKESDLYVELKFDDITRDCAVKKWVVKDTSYEQENSPLNVWNGEE